VAVREAIDWAQKSLADNPRVIDDRRALKKIHQLDPVELCKRQCRK
jgi:hypothetical protein